jgi:hypothetical protein
LLADWTKPYIARAGAQNVMFTACFGKGKMVNETVESLSLALYVKRHTAGKEKIYGIRQ